jgi:hypothetical protein
LTAQILPGVDKKCRVRNSAGVHNQLGAAEAPNISKVCSWGPKETWVQFEELQRTLSISKQKERNAMQPPKKLGRQYQNACNGYRDISCLNRFPPRFRTLDFLKLFTCNGSSSL